MVIIASVVNVTVYSTTLRGVLFLCTRGNMYLCTNHSFCARISPFLDLCYVRTSYSIE